MDYPPFVWAQKIEVTLNNDELVVTGVDPLYETVRDTSPDAFQAYRKSIHRFGPQKREGKNSPHIRFANADNDQQLIRFVERFGPVVSAASHKEERPILPKDLLDKDFEYQVTARQILAELRREQRGYRASLALISKLKQRPKPQIENVTDLTTHILEMAYDWPRQWHRERQLRTAEELGKTEPFWFFDQRSVTRLRRYAGWVTMKQVFNNPAERFGVLDPIHAAHFMICELLNAFRVTVFPWGNTPIEAPEPDLNGGIRPVLYYILKQEYLRGSGVGICRNIDCRDLFEIERAGQEFCCQEHSRLQRQREYWQTRGKKLRKRRHQQASNRAKRSGTR